VGHPEKVPNDPSHRPASHPIKQTDNGQWTQRTDILRSKRRNNTGEQEARQGDILFKKKGSSGLQHELYIVVGQRDYRQQPSHQYNLGTSACSFSRKEFCPAQHKPCTYSQETKSNRTGQRRHLGHLPFEQVNTNVRIKGRTEVHMRAPVEIILRLRWRVS
jgi:hypothetical protein